VNPLNGSAHLPPSGRESETALERGVFAANDAVAHSTDPSAHKVPGSDLTIQDYAELEARWIDRTLAIQTGFRRVDSITGAEIVGRKDGNYSMIPYWRSGIPFTQVCGRSVFGSNFASVGAPAAALRE
jgi:hypothetical protein